MGEMEEFIMKKYNTTKKEMFATVIAIVEGSEHPNKAELVERLNHEIELTSRKSSGEKAQAKATEDSRLMDLVLGVLADGKARTVSEIQACDTNLSVAVGISNSKVTSLLGKLLVADKVTRIQDKRKSLYVIKG